MFLFSVSTNNQLTIDLEHIFDDDQLDSNMSLNKQDEDPINQNFPSRGRLPKHVIFAYFYLFLLVE